MSDELKNAIVLIIAVSFALNFIAPSLVGNSSYNAYKPASRNIADISYSGHLGHTALAYDNPFPGLFPESYRGDIQQELYPQNPEFVTCGLCTCLTGRYSLRPMNPISQYTGESSEADCKLTCQNSGFNFVAFAEKEVVACDYMSTR